MAFTGANHMPDTFKVELLNATFDFSSGTTDTFKIALYTSAAVGTDFGGSSTDMDNTVKYYNANNEVSGTGYTAGGQAIIVSVNPTNDGDGTAAYISFRESGEASDQVVWETATITARGALIYCDTGGPTNNAIAVLDFGSDKTSTAGDFTVQFPTAASGTAIIRIA